LPLNGKAMLRGYKENAREGDRRKCLTFFMRAIKKLLFFKYLAKERKKKQTYSQTERKDYYLPG
jgi:hypothetical protein